MDRINSLLAKFPRVELANIPTPLEKMQRLSQHITGPMYFSKRDDFTGFAGGGNKARQLEYSFGDAIRCGADMILITGAVQSNYVRSAAAAAAKLGLSCHVQLENRVDDMHPLITDLETFYWINSLAQVAQLFISARMRLLPMPVLPI